MGLLLLHFFLLLFYSLNVVHCMTTPSTRRAANAAVELKKAAGSQSVSLLQEVVAKEEWAACEIDRQVGKSALHIAAWKGCLENVQVLVDQVGCNIDSYSTGDFNYGKTAIFYAATQSRVDVVEYLLERQAKVTIVNNKGQSVLSLCASHEMPESVLEKIQALEQQQEEGEQSAWWNFRESHSDLLEYGDLDPRFLGRQVLNTDVLTKYAVNPTSKSTRKGGFARRNPEEYETLVTRKHNQIPKKERNQQKRRQAAGLSQEEKAMLENAWKNLEGAHWGKDEDSQIRKQQIVEDLSIIITLNDKPMKPWIPEAVDRLIQLGRDAQVIAALEQLRVRNEASSGKRLSSLAQKMSARLKAEDQESQSSHHDSKLATTIPTSPTPPILDWTAEPWHVAQEQVRGLSMSLLEGGSSNILQLPRAPSLVDTMEDLVELQSRTQHANLLALDTEWRNTADNQVALATLQVAMVDASSNGDIQCSVIDLLVHDEMYQNAVVAFVKAIFSSSSSKTSQLLLGFAFGNDMPYLQTFTGDPSLENGPMLIDIQKLFGGPKGQLPSLKTCAAQFSNVPLSKEQQCSEWGKRPLSEAQLNYAGLDAAILLILLAEHLRSMAGDQTSVE